jgi:hypothetical protein
MTDMPHVPAIATPHALTSRLRAATLSLLARIRSHLTHAPGNGIARAERHLTAARHRQEARRAADLLLR